MANGQSAYRERLLADAERRIDFSQQAARGFRGGKGGDAHNFLAGVTELAFFVGAGLIAHELFQRRAGRR